MNEYLCVCVWTCVGMRSEISEADLSTILPEEVEEEVRQAAEISMGTEVHSSPAPIHTSQDIVLLIYVCYCVLCPPLLCTGQISCPALGVQVAPSSRHDM